MKHKFRGYFRIEKSRNGEREILLFTENYNGNFLRALIRFKLNENAITEKKVSHIPLDFFCYRK